MVPIERCISQQLQEALRTTILPALTAAVAQHADRASGAVMQPSQVSLVTSALQRATVPCVVVPHLVEIVLLERQNVSNYLLYRLLSFQVPIV